MAIPSELWVASANGLLMRKGRTSLQPAGGTTGFVPVAFTNSNLKYDPAFVRANSGTGKVAPPPTQKFSNSTGEVIISGDDGYYDSLIFPGNVEITGNDNWFTNCKFEGRGFVYGDNANIIDTSGGNRTLIEHCEIARVGTAVSGINGIGTKNFTSRWNNIHHVVDCIRVNSGTTSDDAELATMIGDWMHDVFLLNPDTAYTNSSGNERADGKTHSDLIQMENGVRDVIMQWLVLDAYHTTDGTSNVTTTDSAGNYPGTIDHPQALACIQSTASGSGATPRVLMEGLYLAGGEICINGTADFTDSQLINCVFKDNSPFLSGSGRYINSPTSPGMTKTNNRLEIAGTLV